MVWSLMKLILGIKSPFLNLDTSRLAADQTWSPNEDPVNSSMVESGLAPFSSLHDESKQDPAVKTTASIDRL